MSYFSKESLEANANVNTSVEKKITENGVERTVKTSFSFNYESIS